MWDCMNCAYLVIRSLNDLRDLWILRMCDYMDCIYLVIDSLNDLWDLRILHRSIQYFVVHCLNDSALLVRDVRGN